MTFDPAFTSFIKPFKGLKLNDLVDIYRVSTIKKFQAGTIIASEGDRYPYGLGIVKGIIRTHVLKKDGEEKTVRLVAERDFAGCAACMLGKEPSFEYLQAVEDCVVIRIDYERLNDLAKTNPRILQFICKGFKNALHESVQRIQFFVTLTPEECYLLLLKEQPGSIQRVPQKYLASFIGVTTVSLSRIRARVVSP